MNDPEAREARILQQVRRAWTPTTADASRALGAVLGPGLVASTSDVARASSKAARFGRVLAAVGVGVVAGYVWGFHAGSAAHIVRPAPARIENAGVRPVAPLPGREKLGPTGSTDVAEPARVAPPAPVRSGSLRAATAAASAAPPQALEASAGLDEEVRQLRRIERAVRGGNPRLALVLAEELDRAIPQGQLLLERRAAALMAECQLDAAGAAEKADRFLADNPSSAYGTRVREMCAHAQRIAPITGTDDGNQGGTP